MSRLSNAVDRVVSRLFLRLGRQIGSTPGYFVLVPVLVACVFGTGLQRIRYEDDPEYLFTPTNGRSKSERASVERLFPDGAFDPGRATRPGRFGRVIAVARDGGDVLRLPVFDEALELERVVQNLTVVEDGRRWRYADLCARRHDGACFRNEVLDLRPLVARRADGDPNATLTFPLAARTPRPLFLGGALGGVSTDDHGRVLQCHALHLMYHLDWSDARAEAMARRWEAAFLEAVEATDARLDHLSLAMFVSGTLTQELQKNTQSVLPFLSLTLALMLLFAVATCMMADWVQSKPWLGVVGCISSVLGVAAAFGLVMYFDLEFIGINLAAPFLMLGIGMDDSFVLLAAWRRTDRRLSVVERMGLTYSEAAVSVTITSLTNFVSFWIGAITPFPSVRIFCVYTATAVLFTYVYQVTFFGGCMAVAGHFEHKSMHSVFCVPAMPKSLAVNKGLCFRLFCTGGKNPADPDNPLDNRDHCLMVFFRDHVGLFLSRPRVKVGVVLCFALYLAAGVWGCLQVREGLERHKLSRSDSYSVSFYEREDRFFRRYAYRVQVVIDAPLDYWDPRVQEQVESMLRRFESSRFVSGPELTESWLRAFLRFSVDPRSALLTHGLNISQPDDFGRMMDAFLTVPGLRAFRQDLRMDGRTIVASRFVVQAHDIADANREKEMVLELRRIADAQPFPVTVFQQYFIYFDQFILVRDTSVQSICVAVAVMVLISLLFIPSLHCALFVAFAIVSIEVGVVGYMTLWGVNLDSISMINLIMCIGFSVDYSAHISYAYFSAEKRTPNDGIRAALHALGVPIFQGSVSTILGVVALVFAPSYIFLTFFKTVFLVILFGALHGLLLLPVLLSLSDACFNSALCRACGRFACECHAPDQKDAPPPPLPFHPAPTLVPPLAPLPAEKGSADPWSEKDLGLGTSGESSDGSWKCPREGGGRFEDNPAFSPEEDLPRRTAPPRDRMRSYVEDVALGGGGGYFLGPPRRPATTGRVGDRPRRSRERTPREPDRVFTVRL